ncbi:asparaginyl-tRNA synthetase-like protein [Xylogone sp. PMI_703]|nr:asparaginyl-tRNA synthetase-like protein [Xylogone sp. PMI_703]
MPLAFSHLQPPTAGQNATATAPSLHRSRPPARPAPAAVPISKLLASQPADPDNVTVNGFVRSIRQLKSRSFASIGDGSSLEPLQALLTPEQAHSLSTGTAVRLTGAWKPSPNPKAQSHELHVVGVDVLGTADPATFPLQKKYHTPEYLRTMPHIRTRTAFNTLLLRFRSRSIAQLTSFFASQDFTQTHPPIITSSDCEGAGEVFDVGAGAKIQAPVSPDDDGSFFKAPKYLTVSSQLHLEALAQSVGKVWTLSPTFRAEKSDTARHLSEFYMLEAEAGFVDDMDKIMDLVEDMLRDLTKALYPSQVGQELLHGRRPGENGLQVDPALTQELETRWQGMMKGPWPRITYTDVIDILKSSNQVFEHTPQWGAGLQAEHERYIASTVGHGSPVFVTKYPRAIKPFYMLPSADRPSAPEPGETVDCFDLLVPEVCEIVGGSMREHRYDELIHSMRTHGLIKGETEGDLGPLKWYTELRQWGSVPHGGFGLGFDRLLSYLAGVPNIREIVTFPRWVGRCDC